MSNSRPFELPPSPEDIVFQCEPNIGSVRSEAESQEFPEGYVNLLDREYPIAPIKTGRMIEQFNDLVERFVDPFQPQAVVSAIDTAQAIIAGVELHSNNYRMVQGACISRNDSRTVAGILDLDFDIPNVRIIEYLSRGGYIGPYLMIGQGTKPFYSSGVGLWTRERST